MANASDPIQKGRSAYETLDGRVVDRALVHISNVLPGNIKDALEAMPAVGSPHPEGLAAPLFSRSVVETMDGKNSYGQLSWDNRGGGGYFTGQLKKTSRTDQAVMEPLLVPKCYSASTVPLVQSYSLVAIDRATKLRVETRIVRDAQGIDNILLAIDQQIGKMWFKPSGNYVFVDGVINDSGAGQGEYRVDYLFKLFSAVNANPLGDSSALSGYIPVPALASGETYVYNYTAAGRIVSFGAKWIGFTGGPVLQLPGL